jgi:putative transcriptional regulator
MLRAVKGLAPGFLIAMPQLGDPNFQKSVILMIEHGDGGAMGLVVNRTSNLTLRDLARGQEIKVARLIEAQAVMVGGPVEPQRGFILHDSDEVAERHEVLPGLYLSVTLDALEPLLSQGTARLRFCLGYSGWAPKQLEREISAGAWLFTEAAGDQVLGGEPDKMWDGTLRGMGVDPAMLLPAAGIH